MMEPLLLSRSELETLAPPSLPSFRDLRYDGGGFSAPLSAFTDGDARRLEQLYALLQQLYVPLQRLACAPVVTAAEIHELQTREEWALIPDLACQLGARAKLAPELRNILHDVRGGSLIGLLATVELLEPGIATPDDLLRLFCYTRDHLKIMRNGVTGLDPTGAARDRAIHPHDVRLLREKWEGGRFAVGDEVKSVAFDCSFTGAISTRCAEFAALDRVIYNLFNNAVRHGHAQTIGLSVFLPAGGPGDSVRFVVQNGLSTDQAARIAGLTHGDPSRLLLGGLTSGGHGLGLRICTDFVKNAFGLKSARDAVGRGYIGAQVIADAFVAWFHWPRA